mgnify:CR=1 FL=1|jgi:hypothetical protein|tara:strand:+ start:906 stop:1751 length:846 start_codon:yes stop_codon:yes gene_type:complete
MKIYFGDNQFLGVNHSAGRAIDYLGKYKTAEDVAMTLRDAWAVGIREFSFTVNDKTIEAINIVKADCPFYLHPALPYAHRVNDLILDKGLAGTVMFKIKQFGFFRVAIAGLSALFNRNRKLLSLLVRSELDGIPMENVRSIGLLNIATDFVLGSQRVDLLHDFHYVVSEQFKCRTMFYTMNFSKLADSLWGRGAIDCGIVFNYNKSGFRTNPSLAAVRSSVEYYKDRETIAMSLFSGSPPDEIAGLILQVPSLSGVLFGSSRKDNIKSNYAMLCNRQINQR